jgi:mono/diheme cytochrome c family protein
MPAQGFSQLDDADLAALIAYLKSVPPVDYQPDVSQLRLLGRALLVAGELHLPVEGVKVVTPVPNAPPPGRTAAYGEYLTAIGNCRECHGPLLAGAPSLEPGGLPAWNLTPGGRLATWSEAEFIHAMRTGVRPDGTTISAAMPWRVLARQTDDELGAIYRYLRTQPALPFNAQAE